MVMAMAMTMTIAFGDGDVVDVADFDYYGDGDGQVKSITSRGSVGPEAGENTKLCTGPCASTSTKKTLHTPPRGCIITS